VVLVALLLVVGVVAITWLALREEPDTGELDPIDGMALQADPTPTLPPLRPEVELPGSASLRDMEIVDAADEEVTPLFEAPSERESTRVEPTPRAEPPPTPQQERVEEPLDEPATRDDGAFVEHERREVQEEEAERLEEGMIVGDQPRTREGRAIDPRTVEERRSAEDQARAAGGTTGRTRTPEPTPTAAPEEAPADLPSLRFLSARVQPMGVPLSLRVRPENFLASSVSVYYQWRAEGESGRRKRGLRPQPDGSFALDIGASELQADRLQLWFVAEPGPVRAGSASNPIEVKVR